MNVSYKMMSYALNYDSGSFLCDKLMFQIFDTIFELFHRAKYLLDIVKRNSSLDGV